MNISAYQKNRLYIFSGHYGSGKSEVSVNFALALARVHRTAIVDFDIINPYFRSAGARNALEQGGVRVITPEYANTNVDVPALPAEISYLFDDKSTKAVFDVGGDSAGARAVSRYRDEILLEDTACFFVFNVRRPTTSTADKAIEIYEEILESARVPFTAIINNTNLMAETTERDLLDGLDAAVELSGRLSLPVAFSVFMENPGIGPEPQAFISRSCELKIPIFKLSKHIHMPG